MTMRFAIITITLSFCAPSLELCEILVSQPAFVISIKTLEKNKFILNVFIIPESIYIYTHS